MDWSLGPIRNPELLKSEFFKIAPNENHQRKFLHLMLKILSSNPILVKDSSLYGGSLQCE